MHSKKMPREDEAGDHGDAPTKDGQQNQTLGGWGVERILPRGLRRNQLHPHLVSTSASRTVGQFICCVGPRLWKCITAAEGNNARLPKEAPSKQRPEREEPRKDPREGSSQEPGKPVWSGGCAEWVSGRGGQGQGAACAEPPDQELGMCSQGGGKPPEGAGQGAVLSAPFGETTLEINTREASTPCLGHISTNTWHSVTVIFMVPT